MKLLRHQLPKMIARGNGVLVNVTSMAALVTLPGWLYQSASKTGSAVFSEALRGEVRGSGVHVLTVYPGMTDTPMTQGGLDRYGRSGLVKLLPLGTPAGFARTVRRAIERRKARAFYPPPYAMARWFPRIAGWLSAAVTPKLQPLLPPGQSAKE
jgi:short-subunit dehydrogenase